MAVLSRTRLIPLYSREGESMPRREALMVQPVKARFTALLFLSLIHIYYEEAALILTQADQIGLDVTFFGCDGLDGVIGQLGDKASLAEGVMLLTPFAADAKDEKTQTFTAAYKAAYNDETPNQFAADAYDAIYVIKAAIEKAEATPDMSVSDLCDALKAAMTEILSLIHILKRISR